MMLESLVATDAVFSGDTSRPVPCSAVVLTSKPWTPSWSRGALGVGGGHRGQVSTFDSAEKVVCDEAILFGPREDGR